MKKPIFVFYHMYWDPDKYCLDVFDNTLSKMKQSGLFDKLDLLWINSVGSIDSNLLQSEPFNHPKIKNTTICEDIRTGEMDTINLLQQFSTENPNSAALYLHGKGVTRKGNANVKAWADYMLYFNIEQWQTCFEKLTEYDTCGVNLQYCVPQGPCYSGNLWWANTNYIAKREKIDPNKISKDLPFAVNFARAYCEFWLLDDTSCRPCTLHDSNIDHYMTFYEESRYK